MPLPKEKHDETPATATHENSSDEDFDMVDFPEVPTQPLQSNKGSITAPEMLHFPASALSDDDDDDDQDKSNQLDPEDTVREKSVTDVEAKQFVPFIRPPSQSSATFIKEHDSPSSNSKTKDDDTVDLQDVLAAAQAAAESAERAAAAARSAASIAQLRINELFKKKDGQAPIPNVDNQLDKQNSIGDPGSALDSPLASPPENVLSRETGHHQPQRLPSMDDEAYFTYPNLFTSQGSNLSPQARSSTDSK